MRLIDADALGVCKANRNVFDKPEYADGWNSAIDIIENAPTVDAVEVVHGEWIEYGLRNPQCSVCKKFNYETSRFCPNCGAKMDGERKCDNG